MLKQKEQRKNSRVNVSVGFRNLIINLSANQHFIDGRLHNISLEGCAIKFSKNISNLKYGIEIDSKVILKFHMPYSEKEEQFIETATVKHVSKHNLGVQFDNLSAERYKVILDNLKHLLEKKNR